MMFQTLKTLLELGSHPMQMAQVSAEPGVIALEEDLVLSGSQFLVALIAGLMMAFAFQFLLTDLSVAFAASPGALPDSNESESIGKTIRGIETKLGLFVLITVSIALFIASFLAVKLSLVGSATLGAILGVVIWATYFSVLVWLGSGAVGSLVGSFISTATSGMQSMMGVATTALGANVAKNQVVSTAEEITAAVRRELTSGFDPDSIQKTLQNSLSNLQLPKLNLDEIKGQFETLLKDSDLKDVADSDFLKNIDRDSLVKLVSSRTDFSKQAVDRVADQLESALKSVVGSSGKPQDVTEQLASLLERETAYWIGLNAFSKRLRDASKKSGSKLKSKRSRHRKWQQTRLGGCLAQP